MTSLSQRGRRRPIAEINMIPLIDVALVLLIIFMVMTPFLVQRQIRVNLPKSVTGNDSADKPIVIAVQQEGSINLNGRAVSASTLESELQSLVNADPDRPVVIQADKDIALQKIVTIMDLAKRLHVGRLGISVESPK